MNNALSGRYCNLTALVDVSPRPPVLWIRGDSDQMVSDSPPHLEAPEAFRALLVTFLESVAL